MAWVIVHRRVRLRLGKLTYEVRPALEPQSVKRMLADYAVSIGAAIPIEGMTRDLARSRKAPAGAVTQGESQ
jgi:hypothetical protein